MIAQYTAQDSGCKFAAQIAYMGGQYCGWQRQKQGEAPGARASERQGDSLALDPSPNIIGVQEELETALSKLAHGEKIKVTGAGRTDKGVNAVGQVASFRLDRDWDVSKLRLALNFHLPQDIRVMRVWPVPEDFDARYSALWREYRYFIWHGRVCPPPLSGLVWWRKARWDTDKARQACKLLQGRHDFRAFCKSGECPDNSIRDLTRVRLVRWGAMSVLTVRAPSFLMNMVRIIVGNIDAIAAIKSQAQQQDENEDWQPRTLDWLSELLSGTERENSGMTAPACGLWFWRVGYDHKILPPWPPLSSSNSFFM